MNEYKIKLPHVKLSQRDRDRLQRAKEKTVAAMLWALDAYLNSVDDPIPLSGSGGRASLGSHSSHPSSHEQHEGSKKGR